MPNLKKAALAYAKRGWPVFPCIENGKAPANGDGGFHEATTDRKQIEKWWSENPNYNIGICPGAIGCYALDFDPGADEDDHYLPDTDRIVLSPRGTHYWYRAPEGEKITNKGSYEDDPHVDVRGHNGYVLLPPSRTENGSYDWEAEGDPAFDQELNKIILANNGRDVKSDAREWNIKPDLPQNIERAIKFLRETEPAIEGEGGDNWTYETAAMCRSYGVSQETTLELMAEFWNPRCDPPWDYDDLEAKVGNAYAYASSAPGNMTDEYSRYKMHKLIAERRIKQIEREEGRELDDQEREHIQTTVERTGAFRALDRAGIRKVKPPSWLVANTLAEDAYAILFGAPESYKTFLALDLALCIATGKDWNGKPVIQGPVLYVAGEGHSSLNKRITAWEAEHDLDARDIVVVDPVPHVGRMEEEIDDFLDAAEQYHSRYALVVLDTVSRSMQGMNENAAQDASLFTALTTAIRVNLGATVLAIHHTGHDGNRERGSMVFRADADTTLGMIRPNPNDTRVRLEMYKQKDAEKWEHPLWFSAETPKHYENSIVLRSTDAPARGSKGSDKETVRDKLGLQAADELAANILANLPRGKEYAQSGLASIIMSEEGIGTPEETWKDRLKRFKSDHHFKCWKHFHPERGAYGKWMSDERKRVNE